MNLFFTFSFLLFHMHKYNCKVNTAVNLPDTWYMSHFALGEHHLLGRGSLLSMNNLAVIQSAWKDPSAVHVTRLLLFGGV